MTQNQHSSIRHASNNNNNNKNNKCPLLFTNMPSCCSPTDSYIFDRLQHSGASRPVEHFCSCTQDTTRMAHQQATAATATATAAAAEAAAHAQAMH
jgi:hypothetical protein